MYLLYAVLCAIHVDRHNAYIVDAMKNRTDTVTSATLLSTRTPTTPTGPGI